MVDQVGSTRFERNLVQLGSMVDLGQVRFGRRSGRVEQGRCLVDSVGCILWSGPVELILVDQWPTQTGSSANTSLLDVAGLGYLKEYYLERCIFEFIPTLPQLKVFENSFYSTQRSRHFLL